MNKFVLFTICGLFLHNNSILGQHQQPSRPLSGNSQEQQAWDDGFNVFIQGGNHHHRTNMNSPTINHLVQPAFQLVQKEHHSFLYSVGKFALSQILINLGLHYSKQAIDELLPLRHTVMQYFSRPQSTLYQMEQLLGQERNLQASFKNISQVGILHETLLHEASLAQFSKLFAQKMRHIYAHSYNEETRIHIASLKNVIGKGLLQQAQSCDPKIRKIITQQYAAVEELATMYELQEQTKNLMKPVPKGPLFPFSYPPQARERFEKKRQKRRDHNNKIVEDLYALLQKKEQHKSKSNQKEEIDNNTVVINPILYDEFDMDSSFAADTDQPKEAVFSDKAEGSVVTDVPTTIMFDIPESSQSAEQPAPVAFQESQER